MCVVFRKCAVRLFDAGGSPRVIHRRSDLGLFGDRSRRVMREVGCFDVVKLVVLKVVDLPTFVVRYPFVDSADESGNGGVVDEVGDEDRVLFLDRAFWSGWAGTFGYVRLGV